MAYMKTAAILWIVFAIAGLVGWVLNIVKLVSHIHDPLDALEIARIVGVFAAPLGAVLGFVS